MDEAQRSAERRAASGDSEAALRSNRMVCRSVGHVYDTFKREHPVRHGTSVEIRVCFRCFDVVAGPVGEIAYAGFVPEEAFRGNGGFVIIKKPYAKAHVLGSQQSGYGGYRGTNLRSLCGGTTISVLDVANHAEEDHEGHRSLKINLEGTLDDVTCKNCVSRIATEWNRALVGDVELVGCRSLVRRIGGEGLAAIPKCECLHVVHAGNCPSAPCRCMIRTQGCAGCNFIGPEIPNLHDALADNKLAVPEPWGRFPDAGGFFCPACRDEYAF